MPVGNTPVGNAPVGNTPVGKTPVGTVPSGGNTPLGLELMMGVGNGAGISCGLGTAATIETTEAHTATASIENCIVQVDVEKELEKRRTERV